jgi:hypothetical protein
MTVVMEATYAQKREALLQYYNQGIKPVDPRQPIAEELAQEMVRQLKLYGIPKDAKIGVFDTFLTLTLTLIEHGYNNIVYLENDHKNLTQSQARYYNTIKGGCAKLGVTYYFPPMNNYKRCDMDFDVIIGNPPFQDSKHDAKKNSLWKQFIDFSWDRCTVLSLIVPASFTSPAARFEEVKPYLKHLSFNVKKHFPGVGVQFCRFVLDKNHVGPCTIESYQGDIFELDLSTQTGVPETVTPQLIEDANSIFLNTRVWQKTCEYHTQQKKKFADDGVIDVIHGAKVLKTNLQHSNNSKIRVQCPTTKHPIFTVIQNVGLSQTHIWTEVDSVSEGEELCEWLNSEKVQKVLRQYKWANMYYPQTIKQLG